MSSSGSSSNGSSAQDYLALQQKFEMLGLTAYMKDVVALLLENRPEDPVAFVAEYFATASRGAPPLARSYEWIRYSDRSREAFMDNLVTAYNALNSSTGGPGLTGKQYNKLLRQVCTDFPVDVVHSVMTLLGKGANDMVDFPAFCAGINACLMYEEFFEYAEWLFKGCDQVSTGSISRDSFLSILQKISECKQRAPPASVHRYPSFYPFQSLLFIFHLSPPFLI